MVHDEHDTQGDHEDPDDDHDHQLYKSFNSPPSATETPLVRTTAFVFL